ncbi:hypothetical protein ACFYQ5_08770 [Streptomyces sp. NPDC005794]|uniref:hypothetical protein n=1 Tax=Streptomyces sp. NPDC005794 TaxID=3364733 RepID=UPI003699101A
MTAAAAVPGALAGALPAAPAEPSPPPPPPENPPENPPPENPPPENPPPENPPPGDTQPATPPSADTPPTPADTPTSSDTPPSPDASPLPTEPGELKAEVEIRTAQAPEEVKKEVKEALTKMLALIEDPDVAPEDRAAYMSVVGGITAALKAIQDPDMTPEDRAACIRIVKALTEAMDPPPPSAGSEAPQGPPKWFLRAAGDVGAGLGASHHSNSAPEDPEDRKDIQKNIEEVCDALRTYRDPKSSASEREEAGRKVKQRIEALSNSQYLELLKEIKRYKPSAACVDTIENRTRQVGWSDGSLWGLSDPSCAAALAAGASQEDTRWHALLLCVQRNPFSSCADDIPRE